MSLDTRGFDFGREVPDGDDRERLVCRGCGFVHYENPRIVVGVVPLWGEQVLLCRRAIEPRVGSWTFPAGYLEMGESPQEGAAREAMEEAGAVVEVGSLVGLYPVTHRGQVHMAFAGRLQNEDFAAGIESLEVELFGLDEIPWEELSFPTIRWGLQHFLAAREALERGEAVQPAGPGA